MVQRSMSAGANMQCLPTGIPDGTTNSLRDAEGNSGLEIGGKWIITQFRDYFLDRVKNAHIKFSIYRYMPERNDLICAGNGCSAGDDMARFDWGSADSGPWVMTGRVCSATEGGYTACRYAT